MNEWEARYKALAAGIDDPRLVEQAGRLVDAAREKSAASALTFEEAVEAMLHAVQALRPPSVATSWQAGDILRGGIPQGRDDREEQLRAWAQNRTARMDYIRRSQNPLIRHALRLADEPGKSYATALEVGVCLLLRENLEQFSALVMREERRTDVVVAIPHCTEACCAGRRQPDYADSIEARQDYFEE